MSDLFPTVPDLSGQVERTSELIGRGGYGSVYKGRWLGTAANATPAAVAVKIIEIVLPKDEAQRTKRFKQITRELSLWCSIQHENILPLLGIARINGDANIPAFVSPWMENGNAKEFCSRNPRFSPMLILCDIINGLHYLHTSKPEIVHGDIKAVNVLINNRYKACLCDFGLSRFLIDNTLWKTAGTHAGGTVRWMAPELINGDALTPTKESDIYAYAMTCYEILSGDVPFKPVPNDVAILLKVMNGQRPNRTESFHSDSTWDIITRCWEQKPEDRLPTEKVLGLLREKKEVEEALAKIGEKDVALANIKQEMAVLKVQVAKAEEDLMSLKEEKEEALAKAEEDLKALREKDTALTRVKEEMKILRKNQVAAERKKDDVEGKYQRKVEELRKLFELEETVAMHQTEAAERHQYTERAREDIDQLTEESTSFLHRNSSLFRHYQTKGMDQVDDVTSQPKKARRGLKQRIKQMKDALAKDEKKDVKLSKVEEEMGVLNEQKAEAKMATHKEKPKFTGAEKSLVIGIDVGTTFSGVSYALLEQGKVPRVQSVTRYPGQRQGDPKVPSVVCYDQIGHVIAVGPETNTEENSMLFETADVRLAKWFKLRLQLPNLDVEKKALLERIWSLPEPIDDYDYEDDALLEIEGIGPELSIPYPVTDDFKTPIQVFADFLQYLFKSAKEYITETSDPTFTWSSIERNTYFVLTHPNGWEGKQQSQMIDAAILAGIVDRSTAASRITFITEGEASLHFCLEKIPRLHFEASSLLVVDCGGGTIDITAYSQTEKGDYKEIASPDCLLQGSIFVTSRARDYFTGRFRNSYFGSEDDIEDMARTFEGVKCMFGNPDIRYSVKFAGFRDNDHEYGISRGTFRVDGTQIAQFFQPAVHDIIRGIEKQCKNIKGASVKFVLLTGGFARSPYLYTTLRNHFSSGNIVVLRPDIGYLNKMVADGAVSYFVNPHGAKYSFGMEASWP